MPQIDLPLELVQQIEHSLPAGASVDGFVREAIAMKLDEDERRKEFFRLTDKTRAEMEAQGITEEEILAEFDALRHSN